MSQFLRKPWILQDFLELKSLETKIEQTRSVQIIQFLSYRDAENPEQIITAELSDKSTYVKASFSPSCTKHFERERSLTSMKGALIQLKEYYFRLHKEFGRVACHIHVEKFNYVGSDGCMTFGEPDYLCRNIYVKGRLQKLAQCEQENAGPPNELSEFNDSSKEILQNIFSQQDTSSEIPAKDTLEETEMLQTNSLLGVSIGWKDLTKVTETDCIIPLDQQELLDNLSDWKIEEDIRENLEDLDSFNWCTQIRSTQTAQSGSPVSQQSPSSIDSFSVPVEYGEEIYESQSDIELSEITDSPSTQQVTTGVGGNQTTASNLFGDNFCSQPIELRLIPLNKLIETKKLEALNTSEEDIDSSKHRLYEVSYQSSPAELAADFARYLINNDRNQPQNSYIKANMTAKTSDACDASIPKASPKSQEISLGDTVAAFQEELLLDCESTPNKKLNIVENEDSSKLNSKGKERNLLAITRIGEGIKWKLPGFENPTSLKDLAKKNSTSFGNSLHDDELGSSIEQLKKACDDYGSGLIKDTQDMVPVTQVTSTRFDTIDLDEDIEEGHCTNISEDELSSLESYIDSSVLAEPCPDEYNTKTLFSEGSEALKTSEEKYEAPMKLPADQGHGAIFNNNILYAAAKGTILNNASFKKQQGDPTTFEYYKELRKVYSISWLAKKRKRDPLSEDSTEW